MLKLNSVWIENDSGEERTLIKYIEEDAWEVLGVCYNELLVAISGYKEADLEWKDVPYNVWDKGQFLNNHTLKENKSINV
jgi:hypothetical protein